MSKVDLNLALAHNVLQMVNGYDEENKNKSFLQRFTFLEASDFGITNLSECINFLEMLRQANFINSFGFKIMFTPNNLFFKKFGKTDNNSPYLYVLFK